MLLISFGKYNHSILFCHHRKLSAWAVFTCFFLIIYNLRFPSIGQKSGLTSIAKNSSIHVLLLSMQLRITSKIIYHPHQHT